jgi:hypothetical protein
LGRATERAGVRAVAKNGPGSNRPALRCPAWCVALGAREGLAASCARVLPEFVSTKLSRSESRLNRRPPGRPASSESRQAQLLLSWAGFGSRDLR